MLKTKANRFIVSGLLFIAAMGLTSYSASAFVKSHCCGIKYISFNNKALKNINYLIADRREMPCCKRSGLAEAGFCFLANCFNPYNPLVESESVKINSNNIRIWNNNRSLNDNLNHSIIAGLNIKILHKAKINSASSLSLKAQNDQKLYLKLNTFLI